MDFNSFTNKDSNVEEENDSNIDIYVKQRNGRKSITTIHGISNDKTILKSCAKDLRKKLNCSCSVGTENDKLFLKLSGKDTNLMIEYLTKEMKIDKEKIKIHGD